MVTIKVVSELKNITTNEIFKNRYELILIKNGFQYQEEDTKVEVQFSPLCLKRQNMDTEIIFYFEENKMLITLDCQKKTLEIPIQCMKYKVDAQDEIVIEYQIVGGDHFLVSFTLEEEL